MYPTNIKVHVRVIPYERRHSCITQISMYERKYERKQSPISMPYAAQRVPYNRRHSESGVYKWYVSNPRKQSLFRYHQPHNVFFTNEGILKGVWGGYN